MNVLNIIAGKHIETGKVLGIDEVSSGLSCNCVCLSCGDLLVAKKGKKTAHHFAHKTSVRNDCPETALHFYAKHLFEEMESINLGSLGVGYETHFPQYIDGMFTTRKDIEIGEVGICSSIVEAKVSDFKPDVLSKVLVKGSDAEISFEVVVTHKCDEDKINKIIKEKLTTVEIDVSSLKNEKDITKDDVINALNNPINQKFIHINMDLFRILDQEMVEGWKSKYLHERNGVLSFAKKVKESKYIKLPHYSFDDDIKFVSKSNRVRKKRYEILKNKPKLDINVKVSEVTIGKDNIVIDFSSGKEERSIFLLFKNRQHIYGFNNQHKELVNKYGSDLLCLEIQYGERLNDRFDGDLGSIFDWKDIGKSKKWIAEKNNELTSTYMDEKRKKENIFAETSRIIEECIETGDFPVSTNDFTEVLNERSERIKEVTKRMGPIEFQYDIPFFGCDKDTWMNFAIYHLVKNEGKLFGSKDLYRLLTNDGMPFMDVYTDHYNSRGSEKPLVPHPFSYLSDFMKYLVNNFRCFSYGYNDRWITIKYNSVSNVVYESPNRLTTEKEKSDDSYETKPVPALYIAPVLDDRVYNETYKKIKTYIDTKRFPEINYDFSDVEYLYLIRKEYLQNEGIELESLYFNKYPIPMFGCVDEIWQTFVIYHIAISPKSVCVQDIIKLLIEDGLKVPDVYIDHVSNAGTRESLVSTTNSLIYDFSLKLISNSDRFHKEELNDTFFVGFI